MRSHYRALADNVKDELAAPDETQSLDELISLAIPLDNWLCERRRERVGRQGVPLPAVQTNSPAPAAPFCVSRDITPAPAPVAGPGFSSSHCVEEPMQLGRMRLSQAERECRVRYRRGALVSHNTTSITPSTQILLQGMQKFPQNSFPPQVLVDSGADDNFIDSELCTQANLSTEALPVPKKVFALNGQLLALVTHHTAPLTSQLSGNHQDTISLSVIPSPTSPLVLGLPWLKSHNPHIDWSVSSITNWSTFCHSHCLQSATPPKRYFPY